MKKSSPKSFQRKPQKMFDEEYCPHMALPEWVLGWEDGYFQRGFDRNRKSKSYCCGFKKGRKQREGDVK